MIAARREGAEIQTHKDNGHNPANAPEDQREILSVHVILQEPGVAAQTIFENLKQVKGDQNDPRNEEQAEEQENQDRLIKQSVAQIAADKSPKISAQQSLSGSQIVAVVSEEAHFGTLRPGSFRRAGEKLFNLFDAHFLVMHPGHQPASDVAASRHSGEVVERAEQARFCEGLENSEIEGSAANSAAGKCQAHEAFLGRRASRVDVETQIPGSLKLVRLFAKDLIEGRRGHALSFVLFRGGR